MRYETAAFLLKQTLNRITGNAEEWKDFLNTASRLYRYPFRDQVMIYAQRPDASACAGMELWNQSMGCLVKRGSKGIALIDDAGTKPKVRYVFDVSDIQEMKHGHKPRLWEMQESYEDTIINRLESVYGGTSDTLPFPERLMNLIQAESQEAADRIFRELEQIREGSFLEELDDLNLKLRLRETLYESTAYMVLKRCGIDTDDFPDSFDFPYITDFNTPQTIGELGAAASTLAEEFLVEIRRAVRICEKTNVISRQKPLENTSNIDYNALKRESTDADTHTDSDTNNQPDTELRGGTNYDTDLPSGRRLSDSGTGYAAGDETGTGGNGGTDEIRADAEEIPVRTPSGDLHRDVGGGNPLEPLSGDSETGTGTDGYPDHADGTDRGSDRITEIGGSHELGTPDEQHQIPGGRDHSGGTYQQLTLNLSSQEEDIQRFTDLVMQDIERLAAMEDVSGYRQVSTEEINGSSLKQQGVPDISDTPENSDRQDTPDISDAPENSGRQDAPYVSSTLEHTNGQPPETPAIQEKPDNSAQEPEPQSTSELSENPTKDKSEKPIPANFHITDPHLGEGGPKAKFRRNIDAIRLLKTLEEENRSATHEEQETLSKYVGFGGLANAFDESKPNWKNEYEELKSLLTPQEYQAAMESTLNAHYTSPAVIQAIYDAVGQFGFKNGRILEPAMGVGNFFGMLPETMQESELYGVELDSITGRIAGKLYPDANITVAGFETTKQTDFYDLAVGNVPFGNYKVADKPYDNLGFSIHNYFFAKTLDQIRPGGLIAFITSRYTMDSQDSSARRYISDRAELLGAIRLPNNAFLANAGTDVVSDILFLKKRERTEIHEDNWIYVTQTPDGYTINSYFAEHPELILGTLTAENTQYGREECTVIPLPDKSLEEQLKEAVSRIHGTYEELREEVSENTLQETPDILPADPDVKNYSYTLINGSVYYREDSVMKLAALSGKSAERVKALIGVRDCTQELIRLQTEDYSDAEIGVQQDRLNRVYDDFSAKYGYINGRENKRLFDQDSSYYLLCSLEEFDGDGNFKGKAAMFSRRTIKRAQAVTSVDTSMEALTVSLNEKARVDLGFMAELTGKPEETVTQELSGVIFQNPITENWETVDEYLSGNVREKLSVARLYAANNENYRVNVSALERIQPKELGAADIEVRIGASWIEPRYIEDFMRDVLHTPRYLFTYHNIGVSYAPITGTWNVKGKSADSGNVLVDSTYGTPRANAYRILEDSLNLKDVRIFDTVKDDDGNERRVLNKKETTLASQKQDMLREAFKDWIFKDQERRTDLVSKYNVLFNSTRPREYDGSHLTFPGMTPDIELRPHQLNAVAHQLYGNNTLLAHCVGAGKTFEMIAAAMESKRLGLCHKSLFVVPNHLTEQWASDFLRLYPGANILAATKKDFEPANRKKFCSRIATGDYDAVIIGHSQFEKIPLSEKRQAMLLEAQIDEIEDAITQAKTEKGENFTVKQLMKTRKSLEAKLKKLNDQSRKDDVVTFEQLGVDRLFVDESHSYKNLYLYTKMRNVAGIAQTEAQKSSDMFMKCRYMDEITGGRGITFATGTPISNSMTELYTNMRYLQYDTLNRMGLGQFDAWASSFGETQTAVELAPEGTGYRAKTRFARFYNLPELIRLFKESADIQTPDMLKLPVPEAEYKNIVLKPSEEQKELVSSLADRAESVRNGAVSPTFDNMLKITNDGRKLALDQRLVNDALPDNGTSKTNACVEQAFTIWKDTTDDRSAQLIFCDLSTPKGDGTYNVYEDIKNKLMAKGVPEEEIAFIHDATTEAKKADLFSKVRTGQVRFLLGSTAKMGAGTNVQDRLIALHHLDVPWRPSDIEQQEGRILRQGNRNKKVSIYRYVTEGTFDSYSWQIIENKQKFIGQIMTSKSPVRSCEDVDEAALTYAEVKALSTGNPYIKEKMDLDVQVAKLKLLKANHTSQIYRLEDDITKKYPQEIAALQGIIAGYRADIETYQSCKPQESKTFSMKVGRSVFTDKRKAGEMLLSMCKTAAYDADTPIGSYLGFTLTARYDYFFHLTYLHIKGALNHEVDFGTDSLGNISRINHVLESMANKLASAERKLENTRKQLATAKEEVAKPFAQEEELARKLNRLSELNTLLDLDETGENTLDMEEEDTKEFSNKRQLSR